MTAPDPPVHSPLVFLCGHRKSGTTLLANLFDGHPQLAVYPNDVTLLYAYFPEFLRAHDDPAERRARLRRVLFEELGTRLGRLPSAHGLDLEALEARFFDGLGDGDLGDMRTLIARLMAAFQVVVGRPPSDARRALFKETSIEIYAAEILGWFPDARFVQLVRDPRDNFAALAAGVEGYYGPLGEDRNRTLASLLHRARLGMQMARDNRAAFGPRHYHVLKFEDLTAGPENAMRALAGFLGVDFDPCLLRPSVLGQPTAGNSFEGETMLAVTGRNVGRWHERISEREAQVIEYHLGHEMAAFGYQPAFPPAEQACAAADFYKWHNYALFHTDRFAGKPPA